MAIWHSKLSGVATVVLGSSLKYIGTQAFRDCVNLKSISFNGTKAQWAKVRINPKNEILKMVIHCTDGDYLADPTATASKPIRQLLADHAEEIKVNDFDSLYADALTKSKPFELVPTLTDVLYRAGLDPLKYLHTVPNWFARRLNPVPPQLENIRLSEQITSIGTAAFRYAEGIKTVVIPDTVTSIEEGAFIACKGLQELIFGTGIKKIINRTFQADPAMTLRYSGTTDQFFNDIQITGIPGDRWPTYNATPIECADGTISFADYQDTELQNIINKNKKAFDNQNYGVLYTRLENAGAEKLSALLTEKLLAQGIDPLEHMTSVPSGYRNRMIDTRVTIPANIESVNRSFNGCPNLELVTIAGTPKYLNAYTFDHCPKLVQINYAGTADQWRKLLSDSWGPYSTYGNKTWGQVHIMCSDDILRIDPTDHKAWHSIEEGEE